MNIIYTMKESFAGLRRARFSSFVSVTTVAFLLFIIGIFGIISLNINRIITVLNARIDLQAFITDGFSENEIANLKTRLQKIEGIKQIDFISKMDAALEFQQEFGHDVFQILEENPLPASFNILLFDTRKNSREVERISKLIKKENGIAEVVYHNQIISKLSKFAQIAMFINVLLLITVSMGSLFVVSNTIRLIISVRKNVIETMKLIGATDAFIRSPFIVEGIIQGTVGGVCSSLFLYIVVFIFKSQWPGILAVPEYLLLLLILSGFLLGLTGSLIAVKKFL